MKVQNYEPFGDEWKKEMSKFPKRDLLNFLAIASKENKKLKHHRDTTIGLWATDRPDLVSDPKKLMFQIL